MKTSSILAFAIALALAAPARGASVPRHDDASPRGADGGAPAPVSADVVFTNECAGVRLAGTLTLPASGGPAPAVLLVTGSGPQDRDETIVSLKPFRAIAEHLARNGFAVLRYDDRGVGASTGDFFSATTRDFADDAAAGVEFLKKRPEVDRDRVGVLGHSEGALVAGMVAAGDRGVAFVVMLGGPGIRGEDLLYLQGERLLAASGVPAPAVAANGRVQRTMFSVIRSEPDPAAGAARLRVALAAMPLADRTAAGLTPELVEAQVRQAEMGYRWMRFFVNYDPAPTLRMVKCPVLAMGGALDLQVPAAENLSAIESALRSGGNTAVTIVTLAGHNHLFQKCATGRLEEYLSIDHAISETALRTISDWLANVRSR